MAIYQAMYTSETLGDIVKIVGSKHHKVGGISRDEADISVLVYRMSGCRVTGLVGSWPIMSTDTECPNSPVGYMLESYRKH